MDASTVNLEGMTETDLKDLLRNAQAALEHKTAQRAKATLKDAKRMAAEVGFEATFTKIGKPAAGAGKAFAPRGPARQKYCNPDNPAETWAGRGRPPKWAQAALEAGQRLEDLAIPEAAGDSAAAA